VSLYNAVENTLIGGWCVTRERMSYPEDNPRLIVADMVHDQYTAERIAVGLTILDLLEGLVMASETS
jgi:hypothetical protein